VLRPILLLLVAAALAPAQDTRVILLGTGTPNPDPDRMGPAVAIVSGDRTVTFGELRDRMFRVANAMLGLASPGDRVAILAENLPEYVECYYGVPSAGMALNFLNYRLHPKEWAWILNNAEARVLIVQEKYLDQVEGELGDIPSIEHVVVIGGDGRGGYPSFSDLVGSAAAVEPDVEVDEDATAWLLYTSGTTGFPKGAMLTHRNLTVAILESVIEYEPQPDERSLVAFPLCHVSGYSVPVTHMRGGRIVLTPMFEPELWMQLVDEHGITGTALAPTMFNFILSHPKVNEYKLTSLRSIGYGAAAMPVEVLRNAIARFGPIVYSGFGMTELGGNVLTFPKTAHVRAVNGEEHLLASCGTPMCLADVRVVDRRALASAPRPHLRHLDGDLWKGLAPAVPQGGRGRWFHTATWPATKGLLHRRPHEGHDHQRRRERVQPRGRRGALRASRRIGGGGHRPARSDLGRERHRGHRAAGRHDRQRGGDHQHRPQPPGRFQEAQARHLPR
jgi:acyl-CoA synthetase (AMP-forming)/AMP-acid ligase II